ncbi:MAG: oxygenase MpaB family protein [Solirubrobacterales bacterium]
MLGTAQLSSLLTGGSRTEGARAEEVDGFFAAGSMVRRLHRERVVSFSGVRALLMQACDPLAVVGFARHSAIYDDPAARLRRTDEHMSRIYFGTVEEAERTGAMVRAMHKQVRGRAAADYGPIAKGTPYAASDPALGLWVLASLADSALLYYERVFGRLPAADRERYWVEYRRVGKLLGLPEQAMPATLEGLRAYIDGRLTDGSLWISEDRRREAVAMVLDPPFGGLAKVVAAPLTEMIRLVSAGLLPAQIRTMLALPWDPARAALLRSTLLQLRIGVRFWVEPIRLHPAARASLAA